MSLRQSKLQVPAGARSDAGGAEAEAGRREARRDRRSPASRRDGRRAAAVAHAEPWRRAWKGSITASVVVAAITSCTNTSNPSVMIGAGLLARNAVKRGLKVEAVGEDEPRAGLARRHRVPTRRRACSSISPSSASTSSATAARPASATAARCPNRCPAIVKDENLVVASVLQRQPQLRGAHPVAGARELPGVAAAGRRLRAGRQDADRPDDRAARHGSARRSRSTCKDIWPSEREIQETMLKARCSRRCSDEQYAHVFDGDERWRSLPVPTGERFAWDDDSTYIRNPPFFEGSRSSRRRRPTSSARACSRCSATASRPITSRRRDRSPPTARRGST